MLYFTHYCSVYTVSGYKYYIVAFSDFISYGIIRLFHKSSGAISFYWISYLLTGNKSSPCISEIVLSVQNYNVFTSSGLAFLIYLGEILLFPEGQFTIFSHLEHQFLKLNCEGLSSSCSSSLEYLAAVSCSHSLAESVFLKSLSLLRLISSFHFLYSFNLIYNVENNKKLLLSEFQEHIRLKSIV